MAERRHGRHPSGSHGVAPRRRRRGGRARGVVVGLRARGREPAHAACCGRALAPWPTTGGSPLLATVSVLAMAVLVLAGGACATRGGLGAVVVGDGRPVVRAARRGDARSTAATSTRMPRRACSGTRGSAPTTTSCASWTRRGGSRRRPTWLDTPTPYGPVWLLLARAVAAVSAVTLWVALLLLRLLAVVGVVVMAWAVPDVARRARLVARAAASGWASRCPLVGAHFVGGAHNDALMVGCGPRAVSPWPCAGGSSVACVVIALGRHGQGHGRHRAALRRAPLGPPPTAARLGADDAGDAGERGRRLSGREVVRPAWR